MIQKFFKQNKYTKNHNFIKKNTSHGKTYLVSLWFSKTRLAVSEFAASHQKNFL
jgi:hypothetical protein